MGLNLEEHLQETRVFTPQTMPFLLIVPLNHFCDMCMWRSKRLGVWRGSDTMFHLRQTGHICGAVSGVTHVEHRVSIGSWSLMCPYRSWSTIGMTVLMTWYGTVMNFRECIVKPSWTKWSTCMSLQFWGHQSCDH